MRTIKILAVALFTLSTLAFADAAPATIEIASAFTQRLPPPPPPPGAPRVRVVHRRYVRHHRVRHVSRVRVHLPGPPPPPPAPPRP